MDENTGVGRSVELERFLNDLKAVVRDGQELLQAGMNGLRSKAMDGVTKTEQSVRENPYKSMGMVFGLGVLVGILAVGMLSGGKED